MQLVAPRTDGVKEEGETALTLHRIFGGAAYADLWSSSRKMAEGVRRDTTLARIPHLRPASLHQAG